MAESIRTMNLRYATITGVTRDDLPDEGAWLYAETVRQVHALAPDTGVEILTPDFSGHAELLGQVFDAQPEVFAHNLETVPRIFRRIRPAFTYERSLDVIAQGRAAGMVTKSNLILGMGETRGEISQALVDMHSAGCDLVTITQYLRPTPRHHPVERWVKPEEFVELRQEAEQIGFAGVMSGPLVRSSYRAGTLYRQGAQARDARRSSPAGGIATTAFATTGRPTPHCPRRQRARRQSARRHCRDGIDRHGMTAGRRADAVCFPPPANNHRPARAGCATSGWLRPALGRCAGSLGVHRSASRHRPGLTPDCRRSAGGGHAHYPGPHGQESRALMPPPKRRRRQPR